MRHALKVLIRIVEILDVSNQNLRSTQTRVKTILCVDDDKHLLELVSYTLEGPEYRVLVAKDGLEALAIIDREELDLLVLDWMMPGVSGIEIARGLSRAHSSLPILMLTSRAETRDVAEARSCGVRHYLTKPFSPLELLETVREAVA